MRLSSPAAALVPQKFTFVLRPNTTEVSASPRVGVITCRSGVVWHHGVRPTL